MYYEFETNTNNGKSKSLLSLSTNEQTSESKPHSSTSLNTSKLPPLAIDSSSSLIKTNPSREMAQLQTHQNSQIHRRYSIHSCEQTLPLESLKENSFCDLALITKKKLMLLGGSGTFKSLEERFIVPDVKLNQTFSKHSNSDLRKEVLLASMQRTLSASTEDLLSLSSRGATSTSEHMQTNSDAIITSDNSNNSIDDDYPMDLIFNNVVGNHNNNSSSSEDSIYELNYLKRSTSHQPRKVNLKYRRCLSPGSYMPSETHVNCKF